MLNQEKTAMSPMSRSLTAAESEDTTAAPHGLDDRNKRR
jgi:hypothetical protein